METQFDFSPGDIIEQAGECYQVMESHGHRGLVRHFPSDEETGFEMEWQGSETRRIGQASLPAPSPCSTGGSCPTYEIKPKTEEDANIIARQC